MNTYRVRIRAEAGWVYTHIQARTVYDARDLAASMYGSDATCYLDILI